jgi:hypothetical protein
MLALRHALKEDAMTGIDRRHLIGALAAGGAAAAAARAAAAPAELKLDDIKKETPVACLYHCDFGDSARFDAMLRNMNNHLSVYEFDPFQIKLVMVNHGPGIKYFLDDLTDTPWAKETLDPELAKRAAGLSKYGVETYLCKITFDRLKIPLSKARKDAYIRLVPSGVATVAALQGKGFAYLKSG